MELYRFTGAVTGLLISGGIAFFFTVCGKGMIDGTVFYMMIPPMVLFGSLFDFQFVWRGLMRISEKFKPSFVGAAAFWTVAWPLCKMITDLLTGLYFMHTTGEFLVPSYWNTWGINGIIGYFLYQAMVGSGMGLMFYMAYRPIFVVISHIRVRLGMGDQEHEMSLREEMAEFGFRK